MEDVDGRHFLDALKEIPAPLIKPYLRYLRLFKPHQRALTWSRMLRLTQDLIPALKDGSFVRNGSRHIATAPMLVDLMSGLVESPPPTLKTPLKDHGYLLAMLAAQGEKVAALAERKSEHAKSQRRLNSPFVDQSPPKSSPPPNWKEDLFKQGDNDD